jgi:hypothetical protein
MNAKNIPWTNGKTTKVPRGVTVQVPKWTIHWPKPKAKKNGS